MDKALYQVFSIGSTGMTTIGFLPIFSPSRASKRILNPKKIGTVFCFLILVESSSLGFFLVFFVFFPSQILIFPVYPPNGVSVTEIPLL